MIITCEKCLKNFNIQDNLIPDEGRELQCGSCNFKWFYKKTINTIKLENEISIIPSENDNFIEIENNIEKSNKNLKKTKKIKTKETENSIKEKKLTKNPKIIKNSLVFIISIIAIIILFDTFKLQLNYYIPGLDLLLNNLYESLKDLSLFFKDLIN